jgi:hypothetical protein
MNTTIWVLQGILATVFTGSGLFILFNKEKSTKNLSWLTVFSPGMVAFICLSKVAGAIGLIVPMVTGILPILTPFAALGIALIMALAFAYHIRKKEYKDIPATIIFFTLAIIVAYNRF